MAKIRFKKKDLDKIKSGQRCIRMGRYILCNYIIKGNYIIYSQKGKRMKFRAGRLPRKTKKSSFDIENEQNYS
jgi:hypothetical protein